MSAAVSVSPRFIECDPDDDMRSGFHVARRHDWTDAGRLEVVFLDVEHEDDGTRFAVWRCGGSKPENPMEWEFQTRIAGVRAMPADPLDLLATVH